MAQYGANEWNTHLHSIFSSFNSLYSTLSPVITKQHYKTKESSTATPSMKCHSGIVFRQLLNSSPKRW
jgi:hypothetical protein